MPSKRSSSQSQNIATSRKRVSAASDKPSRVANNHNGFAAARHHLRSVVHDRVGYPLLCYMNRKDWKNVFPEFKDAGENTVGEQVQEAVAFQAADAILSNAYSKWVEDSLALPAEKDEKVPTPGSAEEERESKASAEEEEEEEEDKNKGREKEVKKRPFHQKELTKAIADKMRSALLSPAPDGKPWTVLSESKVIIKKRDTTGSIDVLVQDGEGTPVVMMEVGLRNGEWWKKLDQGLMYVEGLKNFNEPLLFVVLTVETNEDIGANMAEGGRIDEAIKGLNATKASHLKEGRIGTFLVTPRSDGDGGYRLSLLSRVQTSELNELSAHMGRVLGAACLLPTWLKTTSKYCYLGPSCCRFIDDQGKRWVLRVYDNRIAHTDRRPVLYLDKVLGEGGEKVCTISDTDNPDDALPFGMRIEANNESKSKSGTCDNAITSGTVGSESGPGSDAATTIVGSNSSGWLWEKGGQFLAIKVPFRSGRHFATNINDFIPILKHLKKLHQNQCVHGDIRGFNMVMNGPENGRLIDLDYGGHIHDDLDKVPRYPEGYNFTSLADGKRPKRDERSPITMKDDLQAMASLMFGLYEPYDEDSLIEARRCQNFLKQGISELDDGDGEAVVKLVDELLLKFANKAGWKVVPRHDDLREALESFGYDMNKGEEGPVVQGDTGTEESIEQCRVGTDPATGSPSKQKMG